MSTFHRRTASRSQFREYLRSFQPPSKSRDKARALDPATPTPTSGTRIGPAVARPRQRSLPRLYRELYGFLIGHRLGLAWALLALALATLLKLVPPLATKAAIDYVLPGRPFPAWLESVLFLPLPTTQRGGLFVLVAVMLAVAVLGKVLGLSSRWRATRITRHVQVTVRRKVYDHTMRLPLHRVYQLKSGGASSLLREDAGGVGELIFSMMYNPWSAIIQLLGGMVMIAWIDWRLLLGALFLAPGLYYTDLTWHRRIRPLFREVRRERLDIDSQATEVFGGMRVVRAFGRQRSESARFVRRNHFMTRLELRVWWLSRLIELLWEFLMPLASVGLMLYGGLQVIDGRLSIGDLVMFLVYLTMLLEPMAVLASSVTQLQNNLAGFDRVLDVLAEPREMADGVGARRVRKHTVKGRIGLRDVEFIYPGTERTVLCGIDLDVAPGETIALVGRSGSGKTTLCNLIARFYDPTRGSVRLDGTDLRDIDVESYRRLLGIVEQDVFLFDGTIAENIAYGDRRATMARIERAARAANAAAFVEELPDGYNTVIGERGVRLSGGQRQRLAIARALVADPTIFILDEATSNLDSESEQLIQQSLAELLHGRTSFVIAHRLSTIRHADRILVLDEGSIIEIGRHEALMSAGGAYHDMVELQRIEQGDVAG